ncbi:Serine/Threonine-Protein Kinase Lmtk3 [Manis pentadactyla]|nr:Serine/Threonine-Protein Kinase Lmtk3 [Manis pentadactyla]
MGGQSRLARMAAWSPGAQRLEARPQPSPVPTDGFALGRAPLPPHAVVPISCSTSWLSSSSSSPVFAANGGDVGFKVILGRDFLDYTPAQVVVKELRASAGPLEQRKFISEAQPQDGLLQSHVTHHRISPLSIARGEILSIQRIRQQGEQLLSNSSSSIPEDPRCPSGLQQYA